MKILQIRNQNQTMTTEVSNLFIDEYMAEANGEFVKAYLYLLRLSQTPGEDVSESALADRLNCTETDVGRALRYWEKQGLVRREGEELLLLLPTERSAACGRTQAAACVTSEAGAAESMEAASSAVGEESDGRGAKKSTKKYSISQDSLDKLQEDEEFRQILYVAEKYLARPLTPRDMQLFAYLYEDLHFPEDLVEYLVEYCVGGGHRSCRYMESVALGWHAEGKRTVEQAKESHRAYSKANKQVMKAFGITGRMLTSEEQKFVERWTGEYQMSLPVITEACGCTMTAIHQPSFEYTEKILAGWREAGVRTVEDARACREQRRQSRKRSQRESREGATSGNRFQNYEQRRINYDELLNQGGINVYSGREA
ncbi:MAG: DnaD domain protein [Lachnospiraceae bacterium]|nr:DnaD domain protein [Lachnospiraceae bacterium]